jgi:2-aminoadipate transaminase
LPGGLPNPDLFATEELANVAAAVVAEEGKAALQYTTTEGLPALRKFIADRYRKRLGITVSTDNILITNGSQQGLDLIGKVFLDQGDVVAIERPGYLGAIQAFSLYEPRFCGVPLMTDGPDVAALKTVLQQNAPKIFYGIPNSQNPSGITWSQERRKEVSEILQEEGTVFIEDDAYGELRFDGSPHTPLFSLLSDKVILTGSFSKIVAPGLRVGWVVAPSEVIEKITIAKQASDLHSNHLAQRIIARYLAEYSLDEHISRIISRYRGQRDVMIGCIREFFPEEVFCTEPDGGMFLWAELPKDCSSLELFSRALEKRVAILPGKPFYTDGGAENTMRLNFSNQNEDRIREGMCCLSVVLREYLREKRSP